MGLRNQEVEDRLDALAQAYPDPFHVPAGLAEMLSEPASRELLAGGRESSDAILDWLDGAERVDLARVALVLVSRFPPDDIYDRVLGLIRRADLSMAHAFEPGFWLMPLPEEQLAGDLVRLVESTGNPSPLVLLQRPPARHVKNELRRFVERRELPLSRLAISCYGYALSRDDLNILVPLSRWTAAPDVAALAGLFCLQLGSRAGVSGIVAGLMAENDELRQLVTYEVAAFLPKGTMALTGYDSAFPRQDAAEELVTRVEPVRPITEVG